MHALGFVLSEGCTQGSFMGRHQVLLERGKVLSHHVFLYTLTRSPTQQNHVSTMGLWQPSTYPVRYK